MPKLKNFLQDLGSAVVPAAISAGATYASGGTLNPATTPGLLKLLAAVGSGARGFAGNEAEERRRKQMRRQAEEDRRAQGMANLINALQPGTGARTRPAEIAAPKAGLGETLARGTATGIDAFTMAKQAEEAWEDRELARQRAQQVTDAAEVEKQERLGAQQAAQALLAEDKESERLQSIAESQRIGTVPFQSIQEAEASGDPRLRVRPDVPLENIAEQLIAERDFPGVAEQRAAFLEETTTPRTGAAAVGYYEVMEVDKERKRLGREAEQKLVFERRRVQALEDRLTVDQTTAENNQTRLDLLTAKNELAETLAREKRVRDAMRMLQGNIEGNELYEKREANVRFIQDAIQGYASNNALGDLQLLKAVALMQDPTGTVKEQEFETMAGAAGELARWGINLNNYLTEAGGGAGGRRLNEASRNMFVQNAIVAYDNRSAATESDIALAVTREFTISGTPLEKLQQIGNSYHLPTGGSLFGDDEAGKALQGIYDEAKRETEGIYTGTGGLPELPSGDISEEELAELAKMTTDQRRAYGARLLGDAQDSDEEPSPDSGGARFGEVEPPSLSDTGDEEKVGFLKGLAPGLGLGGVTKDYWSKEKQREYDLIGQQWRGNLLGQIGEVGRYLGRGVLDPNRSLRRMRGGT